MAQRVRPFSTGYFILDAQVLDHSGDDVIVPRDMYGELRQYVSQPLLKFETSYHWARPEKTVPSDTIAVPGPIDEREAPPVLMAKEETAHRLVDSGEQPRPA